MTEEKSSGHLASKPPSSLPGFTTYPSGRDVTLRTAATWLHGKKKDDGYGALWRVHNKLYDLTEFISRHPGGSYWLEVSRGTDVTEAFECHHLKGTAEKILEKYAVKEIATPRNSPYTFDEDGFYKTLKKRIVTELPKVPPQSGTKRSHNFLLLSYTLMFFAAGWFLSTPCAVVAGVLLGMLMNCSHNYFHKRDNWRMYAWDLSLMSSAEWRITHAMSHHLYANSIYDWELSGFEPFFDFKATEKSFFNRFVMPVIATLFYPIQFHFDFFRRITMVIQGHQKLRPENLLPLGELALMVVLVGSVQDGLRLWNYVMLLSSFWFALVGIIAAHHHPEIFHEGDAPKYGMDWGLCQLDATRDRWEVNKSDFLVATMYGEHELHHLFPTIEHDILPYLSHVLVETGKEFGMYDVVESRNFSQIQLWIGMYRQLMRNKPRELKID